MAYPPSSFPSSTSSYGDLPPLQGPRRSFTTGHRALSLHERAGLDESDATAEILFTGAAARIIQFSPPTDSIPKDGKDIPPDTDYPVDAIETLPWRSRSEHVMSTGRIYIEKVKGSTTFLKSEDQKFMHAILRNSQCWCVDGVSKFVIRVRKLRYYRIELSCDTAEQQEKVEELKVAFAKVLRYERTPCPFKRAFHVDLPEDAITPRRKGTWKRREPSLSEAPNTDPLPLRRSKTARAWSIQGPVSGMPTQGYGRRGSDYEFSSSRGSSPRGSRFSSGLRPGTPSSRASSEDRYQDEGSGRSESSGADYQSPIDNDMEGGRTFRSRSLALDTGDPAAATLERIRPSTVYRSPSVAARKSQFEQFLRKEEALSPKTPKSAEMKTAPSSPAVVMKLDHSPGSQRWFNDKPATKEQFARGAEAKSTENPASYANENPNLERDNDTMQETNPNPPESTQQPMLEANKEQLEPIAADVARDVEENAPDNKSNQFNTDPAAGVAEPDTHKAIESSASHDSITIDEERPEATPVPPPNDIESTTEVLSENDEALRIPAAWPHSDEIEEAAKTVQEQQDGSEDKSSQMPSATSVQTTNLHTDNLPASYELSPDSALPNMPGALDSFSFPRSTHKRDISELTVTATSYSEHLEGSLSKGEADKISTPTLAPSSASDASWPEVSTPSQPTDGLRQRLQTRGSFSPPSLSPTATSPTSHNQGVFSSELLQKACTMAIVKPIEALGLIFHVLVKIAGGATVNDLLSGELWRRPEQHRRPLGFPDQAQHRDSDEDDFGVPLKGRRSNDSVQGKKVAKERDDDADSLFDDLD